MQEEQPVDIDAIDKRIGEIKTALCRLGPIRPGNLSRQYHDAKRGARAYWQISYTHKGKSRTDYIRDALVDDLRIQVNRCSTKYVLAGNLIFFPGLQLDHSEAAAIFYPTIHQSGGTGRRATFRA